MVILKAITGPNAKKYNGSRGEEGIEVHDECGAVLLQLFLDVCVDVGDEKFEELIAFIENNNKCSPYGFSNYADFVSSDILKENKVWNKLSEMRRLQVEESL
jgi:hypothetical protein